MRYTTFPSALGELLLAGDEMGLRRLCFLADGKATVDTRHWTRDDDTFAEARQQVLAYLDGRRRSFGIDVAPEGSEYQREIWAALLRIPYGQTRTYGELARKLGQDRTAIAVSRVCSANPLPILIPSHRVVAANGIGSYRGGEAIKQHLLDMESSAVTA